MHKTKKRWHRNQRRKTKLFKKLDQLIMLVIIAIALVIAFIAYVYIKGMLPYWQLQALQPKQPSFAMYGLGLVATGLGSYVVVKLTQDYTNRSLPERLIKALPIEAFKYRSTAKVLGSSKQEWKVIEPTKLIEDKTEEIVDIEPIKTYSFDEAYKQSDKYNWYVGQIEGTNDLATFNFTKQSHVLVCGGTNCGKTSTTGFMLALYALKSRFHVIVFDGANGADWNEFKPYTEHYDAMPEHLETIISNIERLYQERQDKLKQLGTANNYDLDKPLQPIVILIDELGYLLDGLRSIDKNQYKSVVQRFQKMIRVIRKVSIHLVLIDQNANSIPQEILTNIKCIFAYNAEGHIGNAIKRYNLDKLKAQGQFNYQGKIVDGWYVKKVLPQYLPSIKPVSQVLMLTDTRLQDEEIVDSIVVIEDTSGKANGALAPLRQPTNTTKPTDTTEPTTLVSPPKAVANRMEFVNRLIEIAKTEQLNDSKVRKYCKELTGKSLDGVASKTILEYITKQIKQ